MSSYYIKTKEGLFYVLNEFKVPVDMVKTCSKMQEGSSIYVGQFIKILQETPSQLPNVPNQLNVIRTNTDELIKNINEGEWIKAANNINIIKTNMNEELVRSLQQASVPIEQITNLNRAISNINRNIMQKNKDAINYANQLNEHISEMLRYFNTSTPTPAPGTPQAPTTTPAPGTPQTPTTTPAPGTPQTPTTTPTPRTPQTPTTTPAPGTPQTPTTTPAPGAPQTPTTTPTPGTPQMPTQTPMPRSPQAPTRTTQTSKQSNFVAVDPIFGVYDAKNYRYIPNKK